MDRASPGAKRSLEVLSGQPLAVASSYSGEQELLRAAGVVVVLAALHLERETLDQRIVWLLEQQGSPSCL